MTHAKLIEKVLEDPSMTQQKLAEAINDVLQDGSAITQSTVSKWINKPHRVSPENAMAIHEITRGRVSFFDFYPKLGKRMSWDKPNLKNKQRPNKPLRNKQEAA